MGGGDEKHSGLKVSVAVVATSSKLDVTKERPVQQREPWESEETPRLRYPHGGGGEPPSTNLFIGRDCVVGIGGVAGKRLTETAKRGTP